MTENDGGYNGRLIYNLLSTEQTLWIIGDSYVRRGAERATENMGSNLGPNGSVYWFGWGGLRWGNLLPFFEQSKGEDLLSSVAAMT